MPTLTVYELRQYTIVPGRLDVALERFQDRLPAMFARHNIRNIGRWSVSAGAATPGFTYLMAYDDLAERERVWSAFYEDDEWWRIRAETQGAEEATERFDLHFLRRSPIWTPARLEPALLSGVHELMFAEIAVGRQTAAAAYCRDTYIPLIEHCGGSVMLVADFITGPALPKMGFMFAWPDADTRQQGWKQINGDRALAEAIAAQRHEHGRALLGRTGSWVLDPTPRLLPEASFA
jgi:hypothetical protein